MSLPGFKAYQTYLALKRHFTSDYDFFKYKGRIRLSEKSFLKRNDKYFFEKIERNHKKELVPFFVSNLLKDDGGWSGSLVGNQAEDVFVDWKKRFQSLKYSFKEDMIKLRDYMDLNDIEFDQLFDCSDGQHPIILKFLIREEISLESFIILDRVLSFRKRINNLDDIVWSEYNRKVMKYSSFIDIDREEFRQILRNIFV